MEFDNDYENKKKPRDHNLEYGCLASRTRFQVSVYVLRRRWTGVRFVTCFRGFGAVG